MKIPNTFLVALWTIVPVSSFVVGNNPSTKSNSICQGMTGRTCGRPAIHKHRHMSTSRAVEDPATICPLLDAPKDPAATFEAAMA